MMDNPIDSLSGTPVADPTRRNFMRLSALAGGGLVAAWFIPGAMRGADAAQATGPAAFQPNAFVRITPDNWITVIVGHTEMGQGVSTALPMIVAEELDADWSRVKWEQSPTDVAYAHPLLHTQLTGGSITTTAQYAPQRQAGAGVRAVLMQAAARRWSVDGASLRTDMGKVIHDASGRSATYGELSTEAAGIAIPEKVTLKDPKNFRIIGKGLRRLDGASKTDGSAQFGMDVHVPGMLTALIARAPVFGGKPRSVDASKALAIRGVSQVFEIPAGIAVVATDFWTAKRGRDALVIDWDPVAGDRVSSEDQRRAYLKLMDNAGTVARKDGDVALAAGQATRTLQADYSFPYLTHATMEPLHAVIDFRGDRAEVWMGTQWPAGDQGAVARVLGLKPEQVKLNIMLTGGGFGRRSTLGFDIAASAAQVAKQVKAPVKVIWTRDQDIRGGYYRPAAHSRITATLDAKGNVTSWSNRIAVQSIAANTPMEKFIVKDGVDHLSVEGAAELPYAIPNVLVDLHTPQYQVPVLWMRSVGHSFNAYAVETFIDELAHAASQDSYAFRRTLLKDKPRHLGVLEAVARAAGWQKTARPGVQRGLAVHDSYGTYVAMVVEASVGKDREIHVHRVVCAVDCGVVVNADLVRAQIESSIVFGLTSALFGQITLDKGVVQESNFDDYQLLRMYQTPVIEAVLVGSTENPGGIGEPIVPCVAPALANALFAAKGERIRALPMNRHGWRIA